MPAKISKIKSERELKKAEYQAHIIQMRAIGESLMGPEEDRSDYEV